MDQLAVVILADPDQGVMDLSCTLYIAFDLIGQVALGASDEGDNSSNKGLQKRHDVFADPVQQVSVFLHDDGRQIQHESGRKPAQPVSFL
jgi:hypothetical protein